MKKLGAAVSHLHFAMLARNRARLKMDTEIDIDAHRVLSSVNTK